jgi:predicted YcjX-like family ATPase
MAPSQSWQTLNATATTKQEKAVETTTITTVQAMMDAGSQMLRLWERIGDNSHDNTMVNCKERRNARTQIHDLIVVVKLFFNNRFFTTKKEIILLDCLPVSEAA